MNNRSPFDSKYQAKDSIIEMGVHLLLRQKTVKCYPPLFTLIGPSSLHKNIKCRLFKMHWPRSVIIIASMIIVLIIKHDEQNESLTT